MTVRCWQQPASEVALMPLSGHFKNLRKLQVRRSIRRRCLDFRFNYSPSWSADTCLELPSKAARKSLCPVLLLLLAGCAGAKNHLSPIAGYVYPSSDLAGEAIVDVRVALLDVSKMDVAARVLSEKETRIKPSWPLRYHLPYDPVLLNPRMTYGISVRVSDIDGHLLAINDTVHQVSRNSDFENFDVLVKPVKARGASLAEFKIACAESQYRIYVYKNFLLRYNSETRSRQVFIQQRSASGGRYMRDSETLFLKGASPPLYLVGEEKIKCEFVGPV